VPNINTPSVNTQTEHESECWMKRLEWRSHEDGDVRHCKHGKIQVVRQFDPGYIYWTDLDFYFYPVLWTRAWWALAKEAKEKTSS
jgi:hypothetical protein